LVECVLQVKKKAEKKIVDGIKKSDRPIRYRLDERGVLAGVEEKPWKGSA